VQQSHRVNSIYIFFSQTVVQPYRTKQKNIYQIVLKSDKNGVNSYS